MDRDRRQGGQGEQDGHSEEALSDAELPFRESLTFSVGVSGVPAYPGSCSNYRPSLMLRPRPWSACLSCLSPLMWVAAGGGGGGLSLLVSACLRLSPLVSRVSHVSFHVALCVPWPGSWLLGLRPSSS